MKQREIKPTPTVREFTWLILIGANANNGGTSPAGRIKQYQKFLHADVVVFTIDYCLKPENAARVYAASTRAGLIPLVTRVSLARLTTTPPPEP
jgi:endo-alpha-1,4-polygalactosaminidase (GH114 family)